MKLTFWYEEFAVIIIFYVSSTSSRRWEISSHYSPEDMCLAYTLYPYSIHTFHPLLAYSLKIPCKPLLSTTFRNTRWVLTTSQPRQAPMDGGMLKDHFCSFRPFSLFCQRRPRLQYLITMRWKSFWYRTHDIL